MPALKPPKPIIIKKYANRRLYNTETSSYVTLEQLCGLVKENKNFVVHDAKTGEDITRSILTQIIVEEEEKAEQSLLPVDFLKQVIRFYDDSFSAILPKYLEFSIQALLRSREQFLNYTQQNFEGSSPFPSIEELSKQQLSLVEGMMKLFSPFFTPPGWSPGESAPPAWAPKQTSPAPASGQTIADLKQQLDALQAQIDALSNAPNKET
ncbi:polyhydroxyalkanoate synthesis repressor PhaR [Alphaproteobacteria bacterium]|nr:polyhydroxyalkanoate synthesis repressor PhaR [Alphaproteobacteria bacterium]